MVVIGMKLLNGVVLCFTILFWAVIALATVSQVTTASSPDWLEHASSLGVFVGCLIATLLSAIGVLLIRALNANSDTLLSFRNELKDLFGRVETTEKEVAYLKGAHETRTGMKLGCVSDLEKMVLRAGRASDDRDII